jgi:hypothetical protein
MELRLLDREGMNKPLLGLPVVYDGGKPTEYAIQHEYAWKKSPDLLFGGYFAHKNGNCLLPT